MVTGRDDDVVLWESFLCTAKSAKTAVEFGEVCLEAIDLSQLLLKGRCQLHYVVAVEFPKVRLEILHDVLGRHMHDLLMRAGCGDRFRERWSEDS